MAGKLGSPDLLVAGLGCSSQEPPDGLVAEERVESAGRYDIAVELEPAVVTKSELEPDRNLDLNWRLRQTDSVSNPSSREAPSSLAAIHH